MVISPISVIDDLSISLSPTNSQVTMSPADIKCERFILGYDCHARCYLAFGDGETAITVTTCLGDTRTASGTHREVDYAKLRLTQSCKSLIEPFHSTFFCYFWLEDGSTRIWRGSYR